VFFAHSSSLSTLHGTSLLQSSMFCFICFVYDMCCAGVCLVLHYLISSSGCSYPIYRTLSCYFSFFSSTFLFLYPLLVLVLLSSSLLSPVTQMQQVWGICKSLCGVGRGGQQVGVQLVRYIQHHTLMVRAVRYSTVDYSTVELS
jgi:hypothetical protein